MRTKLKLSFGDRLVFVLKSALLFIIWISIFYQLSIFYSQRNRMRAESEGERESPFNIECANSAIYSIN